MEAWEKVMRKYGKRLQPHYTKLWERIEQDSSKTNKLGSFLSCVYQEVENKVLMRLESYFSLHTKHRVGSLIFDGLLVERAVAGSTAMLDASVLRAAEAYVTAVYPIEHFKLVEKSMQPTHSDMQRYHGPKDINRILSPMKKHTYLLSEYGHAHGYMRYGGAVAEKHPTIPGVLVTGMENVDYINHVLAPYDYTKTMKMATLVDWFDTHEDLRFRLLKDVNFRSDVISFQNGFLNMETLMFTEWADLDGEPPLTRHFFDVVFNEEVPVKPTPLWDGLLRLQLKEDDMVGMFEVLIGRLLYPVGKYDNWQVMPYLKGDAGTGKSTVLNLVKTMLPVGTVGCVGSTHEAKFGLETLVGKRVVMFPDVPRELSKVLDQQKWQSMVTGEMVPVPRKNKPALHVKWEVPMIAAANYIPDYKDNCGQVARRLALFVFEECVRDGDPHLQSKIEKDELVTVLVRCIDAYRRMAVEHGGLDFKKFCPRLMKRRMDEVSVEANPLAAFIRDGDDRYQVVHKPGATTTLVHLSMIFSKHMQHVHKRYGVSIGRDHHAITSAGFTKEIQNVCAQCGIVNPTKKRCGTHFHQNNKRKKVVFTNMEIVVAPNQF